MWQEYFNVVGIVPGPVIVPRFGKMDFSDPTLSVNYCKELFENDFPYLEITEKGILQLYGNATDNTNFDKPDKHNLPVSG